MQIAISYFYQIRNFKPYMIPFSTAMFDPKWYHDYQGPEYIFLDKRNIINGLRCESLIVQENYSHLCPCEEKDYQTCEFLSTYSQELQKINLNNLLFNFNIFSTWYCNTFKIQHEPIIVLIVYETPKNPCSERQGLINLFKSNNIDCNELLYPIKENYE